MRARIIWLVTSCLMVIALLLASCAPTTPAPSPTPTPTPTSKATQTPTPAPEVIKYGGQLAMPWAVPPADFDDCFGSPSKDWTLYLTNEGLATGDWTKGPAGTGETDFFIGAYNSQFEIPLLAESWEVPDPTTVIYKIRKGVHFGLSPKSEASRLVNGREMTAEDVAFSITRQYTKPGAYGTQTYPGWLESATCPDKWTVVVKGKLIQDSPITVIFQKLNEQLQIVPPEVVQKYGDMRKWENAVGTGPFMLVDYVSGNSATLVRNPNYWRDDPLNPGNRLPYLDGLRCVIIPDESTRMAALRAAKIDVLSEPNQPLTRQSWEGLVKSNPELKWAKGPRNKNWAISLKVNNPDFTPSQRPTRDVRVRQALSMATNRLAIQNEYYGEAELLTYPVSKWSGSGYVPLEKLPQDIQELFQHNPDKAKKLLAEAGYPNGFKCSVITYGASEMIDLLSIVKGNWAKAGVELELDMKEETVWRAIDASRAAPDMFFIDINIVSDQGPYDKPTHPSNMGYVNDPYINEKRAAYNAFENMFNEPLRQKMLAEIELSIRQMYWIQLPLPYIYNMWHPWVKNYHGEAFIGYVNYFAWSTYTWLDLDMKKAMTR